LTADAAKIEQEYVVEVEGDMAPTASTASTTA
jgi:hypothetical protein